MAYAHETLIATDDFTGDYNPLSGRPNWTNRANDDLKTLSGLMRYAAGAQRGSLYTWLPMALPTADYSVECVVGGTADAQNAIGPALRYVDTNNFYHLRLLGANGGLELREWVGGVSTVRGSYTTGNPASGTIRLEVVGNTLKGYLGGTERISYTGTPLALASGQTGIRWYHGDNVVTMDDLKVYGTVVSVVPRIRHHRFGRQAQ